MDWLKNLKAPHLIAGRNAEKIAFNYLNDQGLKLIEKNYSCRHGEIDLVMRLQELLVFIEVRYRESTKFGLPEETVGKAKQRKIVKTAEYFLIDKKMSDLCPCRFDIVAIHGTIPDHKINWITDAFYA